MAFAATLGQLGLSWWERTSSLLGFNLGIETMQLPIVASALPSLLFLSRTPEYAAFRLGGALFTGLASLGWITERVFDVQSRVDNVVNGVAHYAAWIAILFLLGSLLCWSVRVVLAGDRSGAMGRSPLR